MPPTLGGAQGLSASSFPHFAAKAGRGESHASHSAPSGAGALPRPPRHARAVPGVLPRRPLHRAGRWESRGELTSLLGLAAAREARPRMQSGCQIRMPLRLLPLAAPLCPPSSRHAAPGAPPQRQVVPLPQLATTSRTSRTTSAPIKAPRRTRRLLPSSSHQPSGSPAAPAILPL